MPSLSLDVGEIVLRAHDAPVVGSASIVAIARAGRPRGLPLVAQLDDDDFELREVPEAAIEIDGEALDVVLASLRVAENGVRRLLAAKQHDGGAVGARPYRRDRTPVDVVAPVHFSGIDDVGRTRLALKFDKLVVRAVRIELDPDHRSRLPSLIRDDDHAFGVPGQRRDFRADAKVIVNAADALRAFSKRGEEAKSSSFVMPSRCRTMVRR